MRWAVLLVAGSAGAMDMLAVPELEPTLRCSACESTVKQVHRLADAADPEQTVQTGHRLDKRRRVNYRTSELFATEVLEKACEGIDRRYALAQESWGGHFKVFCDETDSVARSMCEPPDWYDPDDVTHRYAGSGVRLRNRCREIVGEREEELVDMITRREQFSVMRKALCEPDCSGSAFDSYRESERAARREWRRRTGRKKGKQKPAGTVPVAGPGEASVGRDPNEKGSNGEVDSKRVFHVDSAVRKRKEEEAEREAARREKAAEARRRREEVAEAERARLERDHARREETKGLTFKEWRAQQQAAEAREDAEHEEQMRRWQERQERKKARRRRSEGDEEL